MKTFKPYTPDQLLLLPPALQDWLPEDHFALFLSDVVEQALDLGPILATYEGDGRGQPASDPILLVKLLRHAYCTEKPSSRKIEQATCDEVSSPQEGLPTLPECIWACAHFAAEISSICPVTPGGAEHGHHVFRRHAGCDVVDRSEHVTAAGPYLGVVDQVRNQEEAGDYERGDHHPLVGLAMALPDKCIGGDEENRCSAVQGRV